MSLSQGLIAMKTLFIAALLAVVAAAVTVLTTRPHQIVAACTAAEC